MPTAGEINYFASKRGRATKPAVIFIHGAGGNYMQWPHYLRRLPDYRIFAIDLPGHGRSAGLGEQSILAYTRKVLDWLQEIGIYQAVFVGHSMGGAIALTLALDYKEHVLGIGLLASGARLKVIPELIEMLSKETTYEVGVNKLIRMNFSEQAPDELQKKLYKQLMGTRSTMVYGDYIACNNFDVMSRLGEIEMPVYVLCGQEDRMTPIKYSEYLADNIKHVNQTIVANAGHMVMLERSEAVSGALEAFLESVPY